MNRERQIEGRGGTDRDTLDAWGRLFECEHLSESTWNNGRMGQHTHTHTHTHTHV